MERCVFNWKSYFLNPMKYFKNTQKHMKYPYPFHNPFIFVSSDECTLNNT